MLGSVESVAGGVSAPTKQGSRGARLPVFTQGTHVGEGVSGS